MQIRGKLSETFPKYMTTVFQFPNYFFIIPSLFFVQFELKQWASVLLSHVSNRSCDRHVTCTVRCPKGTREESGLMTSLLVLKVMTECCFSDGFVTMVTVIAFAHKSFCSTNVCNKFRTKSCINFIFWQWNE